MSISWGAANARARGLATHLLDRDSLLQAAAAGSWPAATRTIVQRGYPLSDGGSGLTPAEFDRAAGQVLADRLALLRPWLGSGSAALAVLTEAAECRALRRLLRGTVQGASRSARLRGAVPTPGLPARALDRLAGASTPADLAAALTRMGHPAGPVLQAAAGSATVSSLWRLEGALARLFAGRASRAARHAGRAVRRFTASLIDLENAQSLLLRSEWGPDVPPEEVFLPGGLVLDRARFATAARLAAERVGSALEEWFGRTPLGPAFADAGGPMAFEARALGALVAWQRREGRRDPLGPGVVLEVIERMRAEAHDVRLVSSAVDLGAPRGVVAAALVTDA